MRHLIYVIAFTGRFEEMRKFYERGLGLPVRRAEKDWIEFDTAGVSLALHRMNDPARRGTMLRFATADLDAMLADLRLRGLEPDGATILTGQGRLAPFRDSDGNRLTVLEPATPVPSGAGPAIETLIVNVADMVAATGFYRDRFGLPVLLQSPWWTELDTGATKLSLHPRVSATDEVRHNAQPVVVGFEVPSIEELGRELASRKLRFSGGPVDQRYGRFAEVEDPDGQVVLFRRTEPREPLAPDHGDREDLAASYEDESPTHAAMRKPLKKGAKATSRVVVKPAYRTKKKSTTGVARKAGKPAAKRAAPSVRGAGPVGTRLKPRHRSDPERVKTRPAVGHLKKAERRSAARKKRADATASRARPLKGAASRRTAAGRGGRTRGR